MRLPPALKRLGAVVTFAILVAASFHVHGAAPVKRRRTPVPPQAVMAPGIYSDLTYIAEAGDILGTEVIIVYGGGKHWALLQVADGAPTEPTLVLATVAGTLIEFPFPQYGDMAVFKG